MSHIGSIELGDNGKKYLNSINGKKIELPVSCSWPEDDTLYFYKDGSPLLPLKFVDKLEEESSIKLDNKPLKDIYNWYRKQEKDVLESLHDIDSGEFEKLCKSLLIEKGYKSELVTSSANEPDGGVDVVGTKENKVVLIQAKKYTSSGSKLSNSEVNKLHSSVTNPTDPFKKLIPEDKEKKGIIITVREPPKNAIKRSNEVDIDIIYGRNLIYDILKYNPRNLI